MIKADIKYDISHDIASGIGAFLMIILAAGVSAVPAGAGDLCGHIYASQTAQYKFTSYSNTSTGSFALSWNDSGVLLDLALISPEGKEVNCTSGDNSSIFYLEDGPYRHLIINDPSPGTWIANILPSSVPPEGADFCISADMISGAPPLSDARPGARLEDRYFSREDGADKHGLYSQLDVDVGIEVSRPGEYSIKGWLCDWRGKKILPSENRRHLEAGSHSINLSFSGYAIRARLAQEPLKLRNLVLTDSAGSTIDHRDIACDISGVKFSDFREPLARFSGNFSDRGANAGPDGRFASLEVDVGLDVIRANQYLVKGTLYDPEGREVASAGRSTASYNLPRGSKEMVIDFDGYSISDSALDGPYELRELGIYTGKGKGWSTLVDYLPVACTTSAYEHDQFTGRPARIVNLTDYGSDINGDRFYDFMTVEAQVNVSSPGNYTLEGDLYDKGGRQLVWSMDQDHLDSGQSKMYLDFDGKTLWTLGADGPYILKNLTLYRENWTFVDSGDLYTTSQYKSSDFVDPVSTEKVLSGNGSGELLVTIKTRDSVQPFHGRYSYDLVGINVPPISSPMEVDRSKSGYSFSMPGAFIPNKPNNFTVEARGVKSLNIGLKKIESNSSRTWVTAQIPADENGVASIDNDLLSPGRYQFKIFGDAAEGTEWVDLSFDAVKKIVINGGFSIAINTSGLPSGNYSISAEAINGSLSLDDIQMDGLSFTA